MYESDTIAGLKQELAEQKAEIKILKAKLKFIQNVVDGSLNNLRQLTSLMEEAASEVE